MCESKTKTTLSPHGTPYNELPHFLNADGKHVFTRNWKPSEGIETRGLAFICHGLCEHSGRYKPLAEALVARGINVFSHDHIGHGHSEGNRAEMTDYNMYIRDILQHTDIIKKKHPGVPIFPIGHAMGGALAILTMNKKQTEFLGCVLLSAAIWPSSGEVTKLKVSVGKAIAYFFPRLGVVSYDTKYLSRSPEEVENYNSDPLVYHGKMKACSVVQLAKALENVASCLDEIEWPVLILHGDANQLTSCEGSKMMFERIQSKDKTLKIYSGYYHTLHLEIPSDAAIVKEDVGSWIEERIVKSLPNTN